MDSSRLPRGVSPIREMFFRCANGRVCDLLLGKTVSRLQFPNICGGGGGDILHEVEDGYSVAHRREQVGAIRTEEQVALAVHRAQEVRELRSPQLAQ